MIYYGEKTVFMQGGNELEVGMKHKNMDLLLKALAERILILDGATGTELQKQGLTEENFRGNLFAASPIPLKGNNDILCLTCPEAVRKVHLSYLEAGSDIIETNTFSANIISQSEYSLGDQVYNIAKAGAAIARECADRYTAMNPAKPRFVAGSIGPTSRTASMSPDVNNPAFRNVTFSELAATYKDAALGNNYNMYGELNVDTTSGDYAFNNVQCDSATLHTTTGKYNLNDFIVTGGLNTDRPNLDISGTSSDVTFKNCDAHYIKVKTTTGDIKGNLLTKKKFDAQTTTGYSLVDNDRTADDICYIRTTTGDIDISVGAK